MLESEASNIAWFSNYPPAGVLQNSLAHLQFFMGKVFRTEVLHHLTFHATYEPQDHYSSLKVITDIFLVGNLFNCYSCHYSNILNWF